MYRSQRPARRPGTILPVFAICLVVLVGFLALGIDVGMMALARTQAQNAADCAALAAARTLSGDPATNNNVANCDPAARRMVSANKLLGSYINGDDPNVVTVEPGSYSYDAASGQFNVSIPRASNEPYSVVRVTVTVKGNRTFFGSVLGLNAFDVTATATAGHRPRDVALVMDFSGSMRFSSLLGIPYSGTRDNGSGTGSGSNNPESVFPKFGHYSAANAGLQFTAETLLGGHHYSPANDTEADAANDTRPAIVNDFYQHPPYTDPDVPAFNNTVTGTGPTIPPASSLNADNLAGGDSPLRIGNVSTNGYAKTVKDVTGSTTKNVSFETTGYQALTGTAFKGYTQGPRYWGKTFFAWPPDPLAANDWRRKFFGTNDNTKLFDASGNFRTPTAGGYTINYAAILAWIKSGPNPFPPLLHSGHITYYTSIPSTIDTSTPTPANKDQRFWKQFIDHCLGLEQSSSGTWSVVNSQVGYGDDFTWGTVQIKAPPTDGRYMDYLDNPRRPRTRFWFGPMTMLDFMGNYNRNRFWWPGTCHEAPIYACKLAFQGALSEVENNHPNDCVTFITFSVPKASANDSNRFNTPRVPLSRNFNLMRASLWYPPATLNADGSNTGVDISPYDAGNNDTPRAMGGTCYSMGLMLAYNQYQFTQSSDAVLRWWVPPSATVPEGLAGGMGRPGAQKMIIFMTDGAPNTLATASLRSAGSVKYYPIRYNPGNPSASEYPSVSSTSDNSTSVRNEIYGIIDQLNAAYSTPRRPLRLHTIAFGPEFDANSAGASEALITLQNMQYRGNTQSDPNTPLDSYKVITGNDVQVMSQLQKALTVIMQGSIQVALMN